MTDASPTAPRTARAALRPALAWYLLGFLPCIVVGTGWLAAAIWTAVCSAASRQAFEDRSSGHAAGGVLALFGSLTILFLSSWSLRPLAVLLFVPAAVFVGLQRIAGPSTTARLRKQPMATALVYILLVLGAYSLGSRLSPLPPLHDDFLFALREDPTPESLTEDERLAAMDAVRAELFGKPLATDGLPPRLLAHHPGTVWVQLFRPAVRSYRAVGSAPAGVLHEALAAATRDALATAPRAPSWASDREAFRILISLGGPERRPRPALLRSLLRIGEGPLEKGAQRRTVKWGIEVYDTEPGVDGLRARDPETGQEGVVLPEDVILEGWLTPRSRKRRYRLDNLEAIWKKLARRTGRPDAPLGSLPYRTFRTYSFGLPSPDEDRTVELYRGNVLFQGEVTEEVLLERIELAGKWLLGTVEPSGRFDYEYFPNRDRHGRGYNEVRHAGSVYGLFHMHHLALAEPTMQDDADDYLEAGLLALDRVYRNLGPPPDAEPSETFVTFLEGNDGERTNSGAPALTLLAFLERPLPEEVEDPALRSKVWKDGDDRIMRGLAQTLAAMTDETGAVYKLWSEAREGGGVEKDGRREPLYYPGEAMLALALYHERTGEPEWLEVARRIGRRQIRVSRGVFAIPDHWVMQALDVLDRLEGSSATEWRAGAYAMGRRYVREQCAPPALIQWPGPLQRPPFPDYRGAYRRTQEVPRTTRAAARGEAIGGVARIAWRHGDPSEAWERSLLEGARHLMEQQYVPDNSFFLPRPDEVQGAIRMGIVDMHVRIDNNQHAVVGMGNALEALRHRRQAAGAAQ